MISDRKRIEHALFQPDGEPVIVTKIEIESCGSGLRWILWCGDRRIYTAPVQPEQLVGMLKCTQVFCTSMFLQTNVPKERIDTSCLEENPFRQRPAQSADGSGRSSAGGGCEKN